MKGSPDSSAAPASSAARPAGLPPVHTRRQGEPADRSAGAGVEMKPLTPSGSLAGEGYSVSGETTPRIAVRPGSSASNTQLVPSEEEVQALYSRVLANATAEGNEAKTADDNPVIHHHSVRDLANKLYGQMHRQQSDGELEAQKENAAQPGHPTLHPNSPGRILWNIVGIIFVLVLVIELPVRLAFYTEFEIDVMFVVSVVMDVFFIVDIAVNARTGYWTPDDVLVMNHKKIWKNYTRCPRGPFYIDLVSALPLDYVGFLFEGSTRDLLRTSRVPKILRLLRVLRLLRLSRLFRYLSRYESKLSVNSAIVRMIKLFMLLLIFAHWNACIYWLAAALDDFPADSWVTRAGLEDSARFKQYTMSLFASLSQMICIGYGPESPLTQLEVWACIWSMMVGASAYAAIIASISAVLLTMDASGSAYVEKFDELKEYMSHKQLPPRVRSRIREHFHRRYTKAKIFSERDILADLPRPLLTAICVHNARSVLTSNPLFQDAREGFLNAVAIAMKPALVLRNELVMVQGEPPSSMYFIEKGSVCLMRGLNRISSLSKGSFFGEISMLWGVPEPLTIRTDVDCDFFTLEEKNFRRIFALYDDVLKLLQQISLQRIASLGIGDCLKRTESCSTFESTSRLHHLDSLHRAAMAREISGGQGTRPSVMSIRNMHSAWRPRHGEPASTAGTPGLQSSSLNPLSPSSHGGGSGGGGLAAHPVLSPASSGPTTTSVGGSVAETPPSPAMFDSRQPSDVAASMGVSVTRAGGPTDRHASSVAPHALRRSGSSSPGPRPGPRSPKT